MVHVENGRILVPRNRFNLRATIECGQVFRYARLDSFPGTGGSGAAYELVSTDKTCLAVEEGRETVIYTRKKDIPYFIRYFDLERSYEPILRELRERTGDRSLLSPASAAFVEAALDYGRGLHILRQDPFETLLSFIISTNNNIKRIQAIIERICTSLGKPCPGPGRFLYAFPKAGEAADKSEELFRTLGCGYRAPWIAAAAERACDGCLDGLEKLPTQELTAALQTFAGIGPKAADCAALFAWGRFDVFPVDTWIKKLYRDLFSVPGSEHGARKRLVDCFGRFSGIAQQFLFFYYREHAASIAGA